MVGVDTVAGSQLLHHLGSKVSKQSLHEAHYPKGIDLGPITKCCKVDIMAWAILSKWEPRALRVALLTAGH
jgi:hypothetical protein